jgi:hypothetical protein
VKTKVEIIRGDGKSDLTLEPFFRTAEEARLIRSLQSIPAQRKFRVFFERFGCFKCGRRDVPCKGHMLCVDCYGRATHALKQIEKEIERGEA